MGRSTLLIAAACAIVAAVALYLRAWGLLALAVVGGVGFAWYRIQVARSAAAEKFFGDVGEETRLTAFQGGSPSEMPVDRQPPAGRAPRDDGH